jgi:hypothetical protein
MFDRFFSVRSALREIENSENGWPIDDLPLLEWRCLMAMLHVK